MACSRSKDRAEGRADARRRAVKDGHGDDPETGPLRVRRAFVGEDRRVDRRDGNRRCPRRDPTCEDRKSVPQAAIAVARTVGMLTQPSSVISARVRPPRTAGARRIAPEMRAERRSL